RGRDQTVAAERTTDRPAADADLGRVAEFAVGMRRPAGAPPPPEAKIAPAQKKRGDGRIGCARRCTVRHVYGLRREACAAYGSGHDRARKQVLPHGGTSPFVGPVTPWIGNLAQNASEICKEESSGTAWR